jgi:hypothetical protein
MNLYSQYALACVGMMLLYTCVRSYVLRKWLGIALVGLGFGVMFVLPPYMPGHAGVVSAGPGTERGNHSRFELL